MDMPPAAGMQFVDAEAEVGSAQLVKPKPSISVIGLDRIGVVTIACLSHLGFELVGVDSDYTKVDAIRSGRSPIVEKGLDGLLARGCRKDLVSACQTPSAGIGTTDVTFVTLKAAISEDGQYDLSELREVFRTIGRAVSYKSGFHVVVLCSSLPPGATRGVLVPEMEQACGGRLGQDFGVCVYPQTIRDGSAVADFFSPAKTVVGASDPKSSQVVEAIFSEIDDQILVTTIEAAELVKMVDDVWHATKTVFGNEVARLSRSLGVDAHEVMDIFVKDTKLNLSAFALRPGTPVGGANMPAHIRAMCHLARVHDVELPLTESLLASNQRHIDDAFARLKPFHHRTIGFLGLTSRPGAMDLAENPTLELMAKLQQHGAQLMAYDPQLAWNSKMRQAIARSGEIARHLSELMDGFSKILTPDIGKVMANCDAVVVNRVTEEFRTAVMTRPDHVHIFDLARLLREQPQEANYSSV